MLKFIKTDSANKDFQLLVKILDADLASRDGAEHAYYAKFNKIDNIKNAIVLASNSNPIGCGAFKEISENTVEIKRMFVAPSHRGNGYAVQILEKLELWAQSMNYSTSVLETGKRQPEAIRLYEKCGYLKIPNYGQYKGIENSVCFQKSLLPAN